MVESGGGDVAFQRPNPGISTNVGAQQVPTEYITADGDHSEQIFIIHIHIKIVAEAQHAKSIVNDS